MNPLGTCADALSIDSLTAALDRLHKAGRQAKGNPLYISAVLLAHHAQGDGVKSILQNLTLRGLPGDSVLDIVAMIMPDENGLLGSAGLAVKEVTGAFDNANQRQVSVIESTAPSGGVHCLFPYGRTVHRGIESSTCRLHETETRTGKKFNHIVIRASGDIRLADPEILAKLIHPLNSPEFEGVFVSTVVQESDWERDELPRRLLVRPKMQAYARSREEYIITPSAEAPGSMSAYMAPFFEEIGISRTWGGGEDGVGFSLLDPRIRGVVVREAKIFHCHAGRSLSEQLLSFGDWLYTGPINRLNRISARRRVDQTRAFRYFMTHGVNGETSRSIILKAGRLKVETPVIHLVRFTHMCIASMLMVMDLLRGRRVPVVE